MSKGLNDTLGFTTRFVVLIDLHQRVDQRIPFLRISVSNGIHKRLLPQDAVNLGFNAVAAGCDVRSAGQRCARGRWREDAAGHK